MQGAGERSPPAGLIWPFRTLFYCRRPRMLRFSFRVSQETICVLVAHNVQEGEWACQVPFFPPHQSAEVRKTTKAYRIPKPRNLPLMFPLYLSSVRTRPSIEDSRDG